MHVELILAVALLGTIQPDERPAPREAAVEESLELRYARARLELARANLSRVEQMNKKLDRTVPGSVVADFRDAAATAELQFKQAAKEAPQDELAIWMRRAESAYRSAHNRWQTAIAANRQVKDTIPVLDVDRFRLRTEVARLQLERGKQLAGAPREAQLAWQVEMLNNEIELLKEETSRVAPFVRYYPIWLY
jgi:hypothetical protein